MRHKIFRITGTLKVFSLFCFHVYSISVSAQISYRLSTNNGLSSNNLTTIIKDRNNYMWMGSFDGVQKHEGARVKVYKVSSVDSLSLSSNEVHALFEDRQGFIWAGTMAGLDRIDPKTDVVRHYTFKSHTYAQKGNGYIYSVFQDKKDSIWVVSDGGLFRLHPQTGGYQQVSSAVKNSNGVYDQHTGYRGSYLAEDGIWLYTAGGMVFYEYSSGKFYSNYYNPDQKKIFGLMPGKIIWANSDICDDKKGNLYFITGDSTLVRYNTKTEQIDSFRISRPGAAWYCCYALACDNQGNIWIGFRHGGIQVFNPSTATFTSIRSDGLNSLIGNNYVFSFAEDYLNRMWVTTSNGIYIVDLYNKGIREIRLTDKMAILEPGTGMLTEDKEGNLYLPYGRGGLMVYKQHTGEVVHYTTNGSFKTCYLLYQDQKDNYWIATRRNLYLAQMTGHAIKIDTTRPLFPSIKGRAGAGVVWVGKTDKTAFVKTGDGQIFPAGDGADLRPISSTGWRKQMCLSADSQYLYYLNEKQDIVRRHVTTQDEQIFSITPLLEQMKFNYTNPRDIVDDGQGHVWVTSQNGLLRYRFADHSIQVYSLRDGLSNAFSFALCRDRNNNIWVATLGGISRYNATTNNFNTVHYLSSSHYQDALGSGLLLKDGKVAFFIGSRLILIDPDRISLVQELPKKLKINEVAVNGHVVDADIQSFSLNQTQNQLRVKFGLLDFENASKVTYFYNLNGSNEDWKPLGNQSELFFYSLSPGNYVLRIKAVDGSGNLIADTIERSFIIHPPFYETGWFLFLILLLVFLGAWQLYIRIKKKYKTQKLLNIFMASLYKHSSMEGMAQDIATNCVNTFGFSNCTVYLLDDKKAVLVPKAGRIGSQEEIRDDISPATIALGKDRLGIVAQKGAAQIIYQGARQMSNTYDKIAVTAELVVPIVADKHVYGIVYSWHPKRNFYTQQHLCLLKEIAAVIAVRISKYFTEERLRSKIAQDLHDDLGSAISSIHINSKMALESPAYININEYLQKIKFNSRNIMDSMSDIVWAIDPQNDTLAQMIIRMKEFAAEILEPLDIHYRFSEEIDCEKLELDLTRRKNLYLIFKESINNAAKYSGCTHVEVRITGNNGNILLLVKDNGKGFRTSEIKKGFGLRNMKQRAADMDAFIEVSSEVGAGTTVQLSMPIT